MKKQILTLAMCIAVSASTIISAEAARHSSCPTKSATCPAKPAEPPKFKSENEAKKFFESKMAQKRAEFYTELGFTAEQREKAEALDAKTKTEAEALHKKFKDERKKLAESSKKSFEAILTKEQKVKFEAIEKERKTKMEQMRKERRSSKGEQKGPKHPMGPRPMDHPQD